MSEGFAVRAAQARQHSCGFEERQPVVRRLRGLVLRALIAAGLALVIVVAPLPWWTPMWFTHFQVPTVVFLFVAYLGVVLYDTFFYDRYRN